MLKKINVKPTFLKQVSFLNTLKFVYVQKKYHMIIFLPGNSIEFYFAKK